MIKKIAIIGCGAYMNASYGCPGEWRCLKAAALGEGKFEEPVQVVSFNKCECPGRATVPNIINFIKMAGIKPDAIYLSSCMVEAKPECKNMSLKEKITFIKEKIGVPVIQGSHNYH